MTLVSRCCRICQDEDDLVDLISPCRCSGTMTYVHQRCLLRWTNESGNADQCEICHSRYNLHRACWTLRLRRYFGKVNSRLVKLLLIVLNIYLLVFLIFSGSLQVSIYSANVPDMDILLWKKSDAYVVVCLDRVCRCRTEVSNNNNNPRWEYTCHYWADRSVFIFSYLSFWVFDEDIDQYDDFIGSVNINIFVMIASGWNGERIRLKWDIPYAGDLIATIRWQSNLLCIFNHIINSFG